MSGPDESKLKPCPFCGGKAHFVLDDSYWVYCENCGATVFALTNLESGGRRIEANIRTWNRRVHDDQGTV